MGKELVFQIENQSLYIEQVLVEYEYTPIFYICKDLTGKYYLVLCIDLDLEKYIIVNISCKRIRDMLIEKISMRECLLEQGIYWEVIAGDTIREDKVSKKNGKQMPLDDLPYEGATIKVTTNEMKQFLSTIEKELYSQNYNDYVVVDGNNNFMFSIYEDFVVRGDVLNINVHKYIELLDKSFKNISEIQAKDTELEKNLLAEEDGGQTEIIRLGISMNMKIEVNNQCEKYAAA